MAAPEELFRIEGMTATHPSECAAVGDTVSDPLWGAGSAAEGDATTVASTEPAFEMLDQFVETVANFSSQCVPFHRPARRHHAEQLCY